MINIHYIQPFSIEKNIGKAYNDACSLIPEEDWICITDYDVCFLRHDSKKQIYDVVEKYGNEIDLFGCITNRLRNLHQLYINFDVNSDILHHKKITDELHTLKYGKIKVIDKTIAGMFLLFSKKLWNEFKFIEQNILFDTLWCKRLLKNGKKIALIEGLYVFHYYRMDQKEPMKSINHLK